MPGLDVPSRPVLAIVSLLDRELTGVAMRITFIGGGNMATALIGGLLAKGISAEDIRAVEVLPESRDRLATDFGIRCSATPDDATLDCDVIVLAVKPQQMREALQPLAGRLGTRLVVSIAAGIRLSDIGRWLGGHARLVRAMPNTPALIGAGITGLCAGVSVCAAEREAAQQILCAVGETLWVEDEAMMDAVTAVSGSGPAYVFYFIEALQHVATELGFTVEQARKLSLETFLGSASLAARSGEDVTVLRQRVTSKGGTTEAALLSMDRDNVAAAIGQAVKAAQLRGRELGEQLGRD
jgi:pyrroline-5-carboxylate reductase